MNDMKVAKRQAAEGGADDLRNIDDKKPQESSVVKAAMIPSRGSSRLHAADRHILLGRGQGATLHPGNIRMRRIVDKYRAHYQEIGRGEKSLLVKKVHDELTSGVTKFLKPSENEDGWEEVSVQVALEKVGHLLRCSKSRKKCDVHHSKVITGRSEVSVPIESTSKLKAPPPSRPRSSQAAGQGHMLGQQHTTGMTMSSIEAGLISHIPLPRNETMRFGVPSLFPNPLYSVNTYLAEMERNCLHSALFAATGPLPFSGTLRGAASASELRCLLMEQNQQIRQLLLRQQLIQAKKQSYHQSIQDSSIYQIPF